MFYDEYFYTFSNKICVCICEAIFNYQISIPGRLVYCNKFSATVTVCGDINASLSWMNIVIPHAWLSVRDQITFPKIAECTYIDLVHYVGAQCKNYHLISHHA